MPRFIRVNARPRRDLARGYSYSMGCFGDEDQAHPGLSGYSLDRGLEDACRALAERMGVSGRFAAKATWVLDRRPHPRVRDDVLMFVTLWEGHYAGRGPDSEDLFRPTRIIASWKTRELRGVEDLIERLRALGVE